MKCAIELETFAAASKLPDGLRFKEWQPGNLVAPSPDESGFHFNRFTMGIERISDGKTIPFEIFPLQKLDGSSLERGKAFLAVAMLAEAVDKAICELEVAP